MNFDYSKIKGKIRELGLTQSEYAKYIGITEQTLNLRFKNKRPFLIWSFVFVKSCKKFDFTA